MFCLEKIFLLLFCVFLVFRLDAQNSPYELSWKVDGPILGTGLGLVGTYIYMESNTKTLTENDILTLDANQVPRWERWATRYDSKASRKMTDYIMYPSFAMPTTLLASAKIRSDKWTVPVMAIESMVLTASFTGLTKATVLRTRPFVYNDAVNMDRKLEKEARYSFFSGHTAQVANATFFTAKVYADYYPDSKWKPLIWTAAAALPTATALGRIFGGKHFPLDVIIGYVLGAGTGWLVPHLHKKKRKYTRIKL